MRDLLRAALLLVASAFIGLFFLYAFLTGGVGGDPTGYVLAGGGLILIGFVSVVLALGRRGEGQPQPLPEGQIRCHMCGAIAPATDNCDECGANLTEGPPRSA